MTNWTEVWKAGFTSATVLGSALIGALAGGGALLYQTATEAAKKTQERKVKLIEEADDCFHECSERWQNFLALHINAVYPDQGLANPNFPQVVGNAFHELNFTAIVADMTKLRRRALMNKFYKLADALEAMAFVGNQYTYFPGQVHEMPKVMILATIQELAKVAGAIEDAILISFESTESQPVSKRIATWFQGFKL